MARACFNIREKVHNILDQVGLDINSLKNRMRVSSLSSSVLDLTKTQDDKINASLKNENTGKVKIRAKDNNKEKAAQASSALNNLSKFRSVSSLKNPSKVSVRPSLGSGEPSNLVRSRKVFGSSVKLSHISGVTSTLRSSKEKIVSNSERKISNQTQNIASSLSRTPINNKDNTSSSSSITTKRKLLSKLPTPRSAPQQRLEVTRSSANSTVIAEKPSTKSNSRNRFLEARKTPNGLYVPLKVIKDANKPTEKTKATVTEKPKSIKPEEISSHGYKKRQPNNKKLAESKPAPKMLCCKETSPKTTVYTTSAVKITEQPDKKQYMLNSVDPLIVSSITELPISKKSADNALIKNIGSTKQNFKKAFSKGPQEQLKNTTGLEKLKSKIPRPSFVHSNRKGDHPAAPSASTYKEKAVKTLKGRKCSSEPIKTGHSSNSAKLISKNSSKLDSANNLLHSIQSPGSKKIDSSTDHCIMNETNKSFDTTELHKTSNYECEKLKGTKLIENDSLSNKIEHLSTLDDQSNQIDSQSSSEKFTVEDSSDVKNVNSSLTDVVKIKPATSKQLNSSFQFEDAEKKNDFTSLISSTVKEDKLFRASDVSLFAKFREIRTSSSLIKQIPEKGKPLKIEEKIDRLNNLNKTLLASEFSNEVKDVKNVRSKSFDSVETYLKKSDSGLFQETDFYDCKDRADQSETKPIFTKKAKYNTYTESMSVSPSENSCSNTAIAAEDNFSEKNETTKALKNVVHVNDTSLLREQKKKDDSWKRFHVSQYDTDLFNFVWPNDHNPKCAEKEDEEIYFDTCTSQQSSNKSTEPKNFDEQTQLKAVEEKQSFQKTSADSEKCLKKVVNKSLDLTDGDGAESELKTSEQDLFSSSQGDKSNYDVEIFCDCVQDNEKSKQESISLDISAKIIADDQVNDKDCECFDAKDQLLHVEPNVKEEMNRDKFFTSTTRLSDDEEQLASIKSLIDKFEVKQKSQQLDNIFGFIDTFLDHVTTNTSNQVAFESVVKEQENESLANTEMDSSKTNEEETKSHLCLDQFQSPISDLNCDHIIEKDVCTADKKLEKTKLSLYNSHYFNSFIKYQTNVQKYIHKISFFNFCLIFSFWNGLIANDMDIGLLLMKKFVQGIRACRVAVENRKKSKSNPLAVHTCNDKNLCKILLDDTTSSAAMLPLPTRCLLNRLFVFVVRFILDTMYWVGVTLIAFFIIWFGVIKLVLDCDLQIDQIFQSDLVTHHRLASHLNVH